MQKTTHYFISLDWLETVLLGGEMVTFEVMLLCLHYKLVHLQSQEFKLFWPSRGLDIDRMIYLVHFKIPVKALRNLNDIYEEEKYP